MPTNLKDWLEPPVFESDAEKTAQAREFNSIILHFGLIILLALVLLVPFFVVKKLEITILLTFLLIGAGSARQLLFWGQVNAGKLLLTGISWITFLLLSFTSGGFSSPAIFYLACVTLITGFMLNPRIANGLTLLTILATLAFALLQNLGWTFPKIFSFSAINSWIAFSLSMLFMTGARNMYVRNIKNTLALARRENAARQQAEITLQESEKKYRNLFQENKDGIAIFLLNPHGPPGCFVEINTAAHEMLGYTRAEMLKLTPPELEPHTPLHEMRVRTAEFLSKGITNFETVLKHKNGEPIFAEFTAQLIEFENKPAVMNIVRDISERKQREKELTALASLSAALRTAPSRTEMLPIIVNELSSLLNSDAIAAEMRDPLTREYIVEAASGAWKPLVGHRQAAGTGLDAEIIESGKPYRNNFIPDETRIEIPVENMRDILAVAVLPLIAQDQLIGCLWMGRKTEISESDFRLFTAIANMSANALHRATLHEKSIQDAENLRQAYDTTLSGWAHALELRDQETEGHTRRVMQMTVNLAQAMGIEEHQLENVRRGALLHDIGKMGIPDSILLKPGSLDDREWEIMRRHPEYAYKLLEPIDYLRPVLNIPYCHHEKWDGSGYPNGLKAENIPLEARIFAIVDVWDALCSDRPYRPAWDPGKVRDYLIEQSGKHFDPQVVAAFLELPVLG